MRLQTSLACLFFVTLLPAAALAQRPGAAVQLPTWSSFGISTTVVVPDSGSALMGGIGRASSGRNEFGSPLSPFRNSSSGSQRGSSSARVTATIHDFEALEQAALGDGGADLTPRGAVVPSLTPRSAQAGKSWQVRGESSADRSLTGVADLQAQRAQQKAAASGEAASLLERGMQAEADGKPNVAKIYYQMVVRRAGGELRDKAQARLDAVGPRAVKSQLANAAR